MLQTPEAPSGGDYGWIDNTGTACDTYGGPGQCFCAYADLEDGGFYTATHAGTFEVTSEPTSIATCLP